MHQSAEGNAFIIGMVNIFNEVCTSGPAAEKHPCRCHQAVCCSAGDVLCLMSYKHGVSSDGQKKLPFALTNILPHEILVETYFLIAAHHEVLHVEMKGKGGL